DQSDPVSQLAANDVRPWYKKLNLRKLYMILLPRCAGAEIAVAFDLVLMSGMQNTPA
ncbi:hypothetical protein B0H14DRAFT_2344990, partial [Mycena olivaceomarginata]